MTGAVVSDEQLAAGHVEIRGTELAWATPLKGTPAVARMGRNTVQCVLVGNPNGEAQIRLASDVKKALSPGNGAQSIDVRARRSLDGASNLWSWGVLTAVAPVVVAGLAIASGVVWATPTSNAAPDVNAVWDKASTSLVGAPGAGSGFLGEITASTGGSPQETQALARSAISVVTSARQQAQTLEAGYDRTTAAERNDHNRAVWIQYIATAALAAVLAFLAVRKVWAGPA